MLTELNRLAKAGGMQSKLILLRDLKIKPCKGCLACEKGGLDRKGECKIRDDMPALLPSLIDSDIIVFGTPVYFEMLSGRLKNFMDRTCPIWPKLAGKGCAGVAVAEEGIGKAIENIKTYASICKMEWLGSATALAKTPRQVAGDSRVLEEIAQLAGILKAFAANQDITGKPAK